MFFFNFFLNLSNFNTNNVKENIFFGLNKNCNIITRNKELLNIFNKVNHTDYNNEFKFLFQSPDEEKNFKSGHLSFPENTIKIFKSRIKSCFRNFYPGFKIYSLKSYILKGALEGPPQTPYQNGIFLFSIIFPENYPFKPPKFIFKTKIFHPNISEDGNVSINILQNEWTHALSTFDKIILSVQSILNDPNSNDYLNQEAARLFIENKEKYEETVIEYKKICKL